MSMKKAMGDYIVRYNNFCIYVNFGKTYSDRKKQQESCAIIAKMTVQCALYMGALKIFGTP